MPFITWQAKYETGIPDIDQQHRTLIKLINELSDSLKTGNVNDKISGVLSELVDYAKNHFAFEEEFMQRMKYAGLKRHREQHASLSQHIVSILLRMRRGDTVSAFELLSFLKGWLDDHIAKEDTKIGEALRRLQEAASVRDR
jgi:hemerythrin